MLAIVEVFLTWTWTQRDPQLTTMQWPLWCSDAPRDGVRDASDAGVGGATADFAFALTALRFGTACRHGRGDGDMFLRGAGGGRPASGPSRSLLCLIFFCAISGVQA